MIACLPGHLSAMIAATLTLVGPADVQAAPPVRYESAPQGHHVQVDGSSNIHDWSAKADRITGWIELPGQWQPVGDAVRLNPQLQPADTPPRLEVQIPVLSLKSGKGGLDDNLYKAMAAKTYPHVTFALTGVNPQASTTPAGAVTWRATGDLTVAGQKRSVELDLTLEPVGNDRLKITVEKPLKMTDFGIKPPTAMLGMARAADEVTVKATWIVQRQTPQPTTPPALAPEAYRQGAWQALEAYGRIGQALAEGAWPKAQASLAELVTAAAALAELDPAELPEPLREPWQATVASLQTGAARCAETRALGSAQAAFAVLTQAVTEAIALIGFDHDEPVAAYHHAGQRGLAGSLWLHVPLADHADKPWPIRSPYGSAGSASPDLAALYLPAPVAHDELEAQP